MSKFLVKLYLFLFGVLLAVLWSHGSQLLNLTSRLIYGGPREVVAIQKMPTFRFEALAVADTTNSDPADMAAELKRMQPNSRVRYFVQKLREGTPNSLRFVETSYVTQITDYHTNLAPQLKAAAVSELINRFTPVDWQYWHEIAMNKRPPTEARRYVERVGEVNVQLGDYLETAAQLFQGLWTMTMKGKVYDMNRDLDFLTKNKSAVLPDGFDPLKYETVPRKFDATITQDQHFISVIENLRGRSVVQYIRANPTKSKEAILLLASVRPRYAEPDIHPAFVSTLNLAASNSTPRFRAEVLRNDVLKSLSQFAAIDQRSARALAEFTLLGALDRIESKDFLEADVLLRESMNFDASLPAQATVQGLLRTQRQHLADEPSKPAPSEKIEPVISSHSSSAISKMSDAELAALGDGREGGFLFALSLIVFFGLLLTPLLVFVYRRVFRDREFTIYGDPSKTTTVLRGHNLVTPPSSINFSGPEEEEEAPQRYVANRYR